MSNRDRPILYEVFGSEGRRRGWRAPLASGDSARGAGRRPAGKELRVSYELAATIGVLAVVLGGTLYYFGWVRGSDPAVDASLAARSVVPVPGAGEASPVGVSSAPSPASRPESCYAVRVFTSSYRSGASDEQIRKQVAPALAVRDLLVSKGHQDARTVLHRNRREVVVYVGRADKASALDGLAQRIRRLTMDGKKQFKTAYVTRITVKR